jgi:VIT1/CCC1 family predicted Fe2+/Mn2+ transporter
MADSLYPGCAVVAWAAVVYRLWDLRKDPHNIALRSLCAALTFAAVTVTLAVPQVGLAVDGAVGIPNLAILMAHLSFVLCSASVHWLLLFWCYPAAEALRKARRFAPIVVLTLMVMVTLFMLAPLEETTSSLAARYARYPYVTPYLLVYLSACLLGQIAVIRLGLRYAKLVGRPWLRRGLRVSVCGAGAGMMFCLCKGAYVVALWLGEQLRYVEAVTPLFASLAAFLFVGGLTMPAWGPRLAGLRAALGRYRSYRRLTPLWLALYRAIPQIALVPPSSFELVTRNLSFRLYRRVIEICDGRLALRQYFDQRVAAAAVRIGRAAGLAGDELDAVVEASLFATALRAKKRGQPASTDLLELHGGSNLSEETAWLVRVATAFAESAVVAAVLIETDAIRPEQPALLT